MLQRSTNRNKSNRRRKKSNYEMYYDKQEPIKYIPSHRILAINRGEKRRIHKSKNTKTRRKNIDVYRKRHNKRKNTPQKC